MVCHGYDIATCSSKTEFLNPIKDFVVVYIKDTNGLSRWDYLQKK